MQPIQKFKKTLLAGALILGTCNAFNASADNFPVLAGAVPDVTAGMVSGYTQLSFGTGIIGNKVGDTCQLNGKTGIDEAVLLWDADHDEAIDGTAASDWGKLAGDACIDSTDGEAMVIEIDGADASTVSVTVADVSGTGWTYTPSSESCVINFGRTTVVDTCDSLASNTVTGIGMSLTVANDGIGGVEDVATIYEWAAMSGKTRMVLGGLITIDSTIPAGTVITDNVIVQVTYE